MSRHVATLRCTPTADRTMPDLDDLQLPAHDLPAAAPAAGR